MTTVSINFPEEITTIRICPPLPGKKFCMVIRYHRIGMRSFQCHKKLHQGKWEGNCVCCEQYRKFYPPDYAYLPDPPPFYKGNVDDFSRDVKNLQPIENYYFNIITRGMEDKGVGKFSCRKGLYVKMLEGIKGNESNPNVAKLGDITHPTKGHDLYVRKVTKATDSGNWVDYSNSHFLPSTPLGTTEQIMEWMNQLHNLEELRILSPEDEMMNVMDETFGYLGSVRPKQKYRSISAPFNPAW